MRETPEERKHIIVIPSVDVIKDGEKDRARVVHVIESEQTVNPVLSVITCVRIAQAHLPIPRGVLILFAFNPILVEYFAVWSQAVPPEQFSHLSNSSLLIVYSWTRAQHSYATNQMF